ncbi:MAG TPA: M28 family peptidase [Pyrinomonadaceae bacterium]|nr:M28 family peptidase [Pyrinomonadaceae bacterium]
MKKTLSLLLLTAYAIQAAFAQDFTKLFNADKMRQRVIRLSADDFEGRGPGTAGGKRAAQYIADELKAAGVKPGNGKSYFQNVKMIGVKADPNTKLNVTGPTGTQSFNFGDEFVATTSAQKDSVSIDSEIVFVGHGVDAPIFNWNDFSGPAEDYRGKVLLIMVNDPPATAAEPNLFGGKALTYYGRWTYKYEEAARRGAAGVILIHTTESAGYGWNVVRTSNGNWRYEIARTPTDVTPFLNVKSWMTYDAAKKMLAGGNLNIDEMTAAAKQRGFKPIRTGLKMKLDLKSEFQTFDSPNVVGMVEGSDAKLKNEHVIYTAHWDHLGIGEGNAIGDKIFNGAYDNASGVAATLGIAEVLAKMPKKQRPKRSSYFLFTTAEEQGLLGAEYFASHPLIPLNKIAGNVNIDGVNFFGRVTDFSALGVERSSLDTVVNEVAKEKNLTLEGDMSPEQGFFFRSDHFPFAKVGVPAISLRHGDAFVTPLKGEALSFFSEYTAKYYHQATDEYKNWWDTDAMIQNAELGLAIGTKIGNLPSMPRYKDSDEFAAADKKRLVK